MSTAGIAATGAVATAQLFAGFQQAQIIRGQAKLKRKLDEINIAEVEQQGFEAEAAGAAEVARYTQVIDSTIGAQRVGYASQGVDVGYGTAAEVQAQTKITGLANMIDIERAAREKALGIRRQARSIRLGMGFDEINTDAQAGAAQFAGITGAAATGLSGYSRYGGGGSSTAGGTETGGTQGKAEATPSSRGVASTVGDFYGSGPRGSGGHYEPKPRWWEV